MHGWITERAYRTCSDYHYVCSDCFSSKLQSSVKPHKIATKDKNNYKETQNNNVKTENDKELKMPKTMKQSDHKYLSIMFELSTHFLKWEI